MEPTVGMGRDKEVVSLMGHKWPIHYQTCHLMLLGGNLISHFSPPNFVFDLKYYYLEKLKFHNFSSIKL